MNTEEQQLLDELTTQLEEQTAIEIQIRVDEHRRKLLVARLKSAVEQTEVSVTAKEFSRMLSCLDERLFPQEQ